MSIQTLAILFFPGVFHYRIMSLGRQRLVHWYMRTNISDDPTASIIKVVSWSCDIRSKKTAILWPLSEEPQISLVSFYFISIKFTSPKHGHKLHLSSLSSNHKDFFLKFSTKTLEWIYYCPTACYEGHLLYPPWFSYANKTNNQLQMYNFTIPTVLCFPFSSLPLDTHSTMAVCLHSLLLPLSVCYIHV